MLYRGVQEVECQPPESDTDEALWKKPELHLISLKYRIFYGGEVEMDDDSTIEVFAVTNPQPWWFVDGYRSGKWFR